MRKPLWMPSQERMEQANVTRFIKFVNERHGFKFSSYDELYKWSIDNIQDFWEAMWEFGKIKASRR
ncbi:acetoacetate--CoA ligase, partial [Candidatus Bathyarchaeota archaeon]|nr:acetoacetate--CoA ligase [Candidatus Bathyarchaeota archaeon]